MSELLDFSVQVTFDKKVSRIEPEISGSLPLVSLYPTPVPGVQLLRQKQMCSWPYCEIQTVDRCLWYDCGGAQKGCGQPICKIHQGAYPFSTEWVNRPNLQHRAFVEQPTPCKNCYPQARRSFKARYSIIFLILLMFPVIFVAIYVPYLKKHKNVSIDLANNN